MLSPACDQFRRDFEPREADPRRDVHRRSCDACDVWASRLEAAAAGEAPRPLPAVLRRRLAAIPAAAGVTCRDVERLYGAALGRVRGASGDEAAALHLRGCRRCAELYGTLETAFREPRLPLSAALRTRLGRIARAVPSRARLPWWVRDGHLAVAASALLTLALHLVVGNPVALVQHAAATVGVRAESLAAAGEKRGQEALKEMTNEVETSVARVRSQLRYYGTTYELLWRDTRGYYDRVLSEDQPWPKLWQSSGPRDEKEGDDDGKS